MLRTLIADDEAPARNRLRKLLNPFVDQKRIQIVDEAEDGIETLEKLNANPVDLLFLDIQMPGLDGFEVIERIDPADRPVIVFTTAYDSYALRAFEANAIDYLLKPISSERLQITVARVERMRSEPELRAGGDERMARLLDWIDLQAEKESPVTKRSGDYLQQISVPFRDRILILPVSRLIAAEVEEGITRLHVMADEDPVGGRATQSYVVNYTLDQLEANLNPEEFLRVHRSAIVGISHIREMIPWFSGRYKLGLTGGHTVIASRERSRQLREKLLM